MSNYTCPLTLKKTYNSGYIYYGDKNDRQLKKGERTTVSTVRRDIGDI